MQRLPRYTLLLREILKHIPDPAEAAAEAAADEAAADEAAAEAESPAGTLPAAAAAAAAAAALQASYASTASDASHGECSRRTELEAPPRMPRATPEQRSGPQDEALEAAASKGANPLLRLALERIKQVTAGVDASVGDSERRQRAMKVLRDSLRREDLIAPSRALLREGKLTKLRQAVANPLAMLSRAPALPHASARDAFLFSDILILASGEVTATQRHAAPSSAIKCRRVPPSATNDTPPPLGRIHRARRTSGAPRRRGGCASSISRRWSSSPPTPCAPQPSTKRRQSDTQCSPMRRAPSEYPTSTPSILRVSSEYPPSIHRVPWARRLCLPCTHGRCSARPSLTFHDLP